MFLKPLLFLQNAPMVTSAPQTMTSSMSVPPPTIHVPVRLFVKHYQNKSQTSFTQPPPNMMMMTADPLAPPGTSPMVPAMSAAMHTSQPTLPPIPGVGMIDTMLVYCFNFICYIGTIVHHCQPIMVPNLWMFGRHF